MKSSDVTRVLSACGIFLAGPITSDAVAFARAVDVGSRKALLLFAQENPRSVLAKDAVRISSGVSDQKGSIRTSISPERSWRQGDGNPLLLAAYSFNPAVHDRGSPSNSNHSQRAKPAIAAQQQAVAQISAAVSRFEQDASRCRGQSFNVTQECVADALDKFSRGLSTVKQAPGVVVPAAIPVIKQVAKRIRASKSKKEARAAIAEAVPQITSSIELVMADNEDSIYRLQERQRSLVVKPLTIADEVLIQATGI